MSFDSNVRNFADDPGTFLGGSWRSMHSVRAQELDHLQLGALRMRFADLRDRLPVLTNLADKLGIETIEVFDDVVPLLFPHTVYKSYPVTLLDRSNFEALTRWLDRLTVRDLTGIDVSACDSIDSWLDALDAETDLRVSHSSGTTGTMSFFPRTAGEWNRQLRLVRQGLFQLSDPEGLRDHSGDYFDVVWPTFRYGRSAVLRSADEQVRTIAGSEERFHAMHPGRMSSDVMFLAARLRAAEARGELRQVEVSGSLRARHDEFMALQRDMQHAVPRFLAETTEKLHGRPIYILGTWNALYEFARAGLECGRKGVFAPESVILAGGGAKGQAIPGDWKDVIQSFIGVDHLQHGYGMTELMPVNYLCEHDRYHLHPGALLFVLDPERGVPMPREGVQTGRAAFFDLMAETYWGGFVTGDEITVDWSPCKCGLSSAHIAPTIERYSEKKGGDDKITCAAAEEAHQDALAFLSGQPG
jgi:hypothetical protein